MLLLHLDQSSGALGLRILSNLAESSCPILWSRGRGCPARYPPPEPFRPRACDSPCVASADLRSLAEMWVFRLKVGSPRTEGKCTVAGR